MQRVLRRAELAELAGLFFLHGMALGAWFVPLGQVLDTHGLQVIKPFAFAASATAALVSPLFFGAMADRHLAPIHVLRLLALANAGATALTATAIARAHGQWMVLACIQLQALCIAPTWGISCSIVFSRLQNPARQFGPVRSLGTLGWMAGCWLVSALRADSSTLSGFCDAALWLGLGLFTWLLPATTPDASARPTTLRERMGLDALGLLKERDHRVVFFTTAFFAIPVAAFYPFAPTQLRELGLERTAAWMTLGQITEMAAMLALPALLARWRLKWILLTGLSFGLIRYVLCALDGKGWVLAGVSLHGFAFTLLFITVQVYLDQRVPPAWRTRAQALFSLMQSGVGNLLGYLGTGWWMSACQTPTGTDWRRYWGGLAAVVAFVWIYFLVAYRGQASQRARAGGAAMARVEPRDVHPDG